jgi:hypothetical protein
MKLKVKNQTISLNKYDLFIVLLTAMAIIAIITIWISYEHKGQYLEQEINRLN